MLVMAAKQSSLQLPTCLLALALQALRAKALVTMVSGGGALNNSASVLSADGKYVLTAASASVRLHSAVTAETVQTLDGHTQDVTAIVLDESNQEQVNFMRKLSACAALLNCLAKQDGFT